jgi:hypothetical protein
MKIHNFKYLLLASLAFASCSKEIEEEVVAEVQVSAGTANFSKYVALGNSLTAGFSDGALFKAGQANSYVKLLADQFASVGGGSFKIPYTNDNVGGLLAGGTQIPGFGPRLVFNGVGPAPLNAVPTTEIGVPLSGPFNNLGVPGAKVFHLLAPNYGNIANLPTGTANPYFVRFRSAPGTSVINDAMVQQPTFFSLWIGNNDVLGYATAGGDTTNPSNTITPLAGPPGVGFQASYETLVNTLTAQGAKGVVANIPNVTTIPHFTTIQHNQIPGLPAANASQLNQLFGGINQALTNAGLPTRFRTLIADDGNPATIERNPILITDETLPNISSQITAGLTPIFGATAAAALGVLYGQARHANGASANTVRDLIVLPAGSILGQPQAGATAPFNIQGVSFPIGDRWVLLPSEQAEIRTATDAFNNVIKNAAAAKGLAFVDAAAIMTQAATTGIRFGTFSMNASLVTGGVFGLDGIHLTARANAYAANKFLEAIETTYGAKFNKYGPELFPISYPATLSN